MDTDFKRPTDYRLPATVKAAGLVGSKLSALAAYQKGDGHLSYSTIQRFWNEVLGIPISRGQLVNVVQKASAAFARAMDRIRHGFLKAVRRPPQRAEAQNLAERFRGSEADHYFRFLTTPGIEPTNHQTEQAIRHIVIDRHITQGTRGKRGQRWCERV